MDKPFLAALFDVAVQAADPLTGIRAHLPEPPPSGRTVVIGAGKGAAQMAAALETLWPGPLTGIVVTRYGYGCETRGIEVLEVSPERVVASMPVEPNRQPYGLLHGGASAVLAETVGSIASAMHAATLGLAAVGIELNCTHHRSAREGTVTGTATPLHRGGSVATYAIEILDDAGRLVCTSRLTCMLISPPTSRRPDPTT